MAILVANVVNKDRYHRCTTHLYSNVFFLMMPCSQVELTAQSTAQESKNGPEKRLRRWFQEAESSYHEGKLWY